MNKETREEKRVIGNVGVLDLRGASEESVFGIRKIGNVGTLLFSPETAALTTRLSIGNVGNTVEADPDALLRTGRERLTRSSFQNRQEPLKLIVSGQLIVDSDVAAEDVEQGLGELVVIGNVVCPESVAGSIQAKLRQLIGRIETYRQGATVHVGEVRLDHLYLQTLAEGSSLMVVGNLILPEVLPNEALAEKIERLQVTGRVMCHAENAETLLARLDTRAARPRLTVIPPEHTLITRQLLLDRGLLEALPSRKLYCSDRVMVAEDVSEELLDSALDRLVTGERLIAPARLQKVLSTKIDVLETQAIFYEGALWMVEDVSDIGQANFDFQEGQVTLIVQGVLNIERDVAPQTLAERLAKVHNLGVISGTPEQLGALRSRLGIQEGVLEGDSPKEGGEGGLGNIGYLRL